MAAALKDSEIQRLMKPLIYNRRHLRLNIIMLVQSFNTIPLPVRKTISHLAMLKIKNKREYEAIFKELIFLDPRTADSLMRFVFRERYDFLFCDVEKSLFYKKFDRINLNPEGDNEVQQ
eukprot:jgi/Tetstr1/449677/TSEL_036745.t1